MNIIVCVNFFPDVNIITLYPVGGGRIEQDDLVYTVHPSDLVAVEEALRLREKNGSGKVILVALSSPPAERLLRQCLALGADEANLIDAPNFQNEDGYAVGAVLAKCCGAMNFDLILGGHGSLDNFGGQAGYVIANLLNLPLITRVTRIIITPEKTDMLVEKRLERGYREQMKVSLPAILTLEESLNQPRYASLPNMLYALATGIKRMSLEDLASFPQELEDLIQPKLKLLQMKIPKPRPKKIFTPETSLSAEDRMWQIMSGGLDNKSKNKELFEGSPEELSSKFLDYLKQLDIEPVLIKK